MSRKAPASTPPPPTRLPPLAGGDGAADRIAGATGSVWDATGGSGTAATYRSRCASVLQPPRAARRRPRGRRGADRFGRRSVGGLWAGLPARVEAASLSTSL